MPPPEHTCIANEWPVDLAQGRFHVRQRIYRNKIVDFAIMQLHAEATASQGQIARIDCCHGTVHRHRFDKQGRDILDGRVICNIPVDTGWSVVDSLFQQCWDQMVSQAAENLKAWSQS